jgi:hypothetical protein
VATPCRLSLRSRLWIVCPRASNVEVLLVFLRLGCRAFCEPIAHLCCFRENFLAEVLAKVGTLFE